MDKINGNLTSFEIINAYEELVDLMVEASDPMTPSERVQEIDSQAHEIFESLGAEVPEKLDKLRAVATRMQAEADLLKEESRRLSKRVKSIETAVSRCRGFAGGILKARRLAGDDPKVKTPEGSYWLARSTSIEGPQHISAWEEHGWVKTRVEPDRAAAKKALKTGEVIDCFMLTLNESVRWR